MQYLGIARGCNSSNPNLPFNLMALKYSTSSIRVTQRKNLIHSHSFFLSPFSFPVHTFLSPTLHSSSQSSPLFSLVFKKSRRSCCRFRSCAKPPSSYEQVSNQPPLRHPPASVSLLQRSINPCYAFASSTAQHLQSVPPAQSLPSKFSLFLTFHWEHERK